MVQHDVVPKDAAMARGIVRILLVEDDEDDARLVQWHLDALEDMEVGLEHVTHLSEGLKRLARCPFDTVLLDLGLSESTGLDTFQELHRQYPDVPVVVLTGLNATETAVAVIKAGAEDYLVKDRLDSSQLARALRLAAERRRFSRLAADHDYLKCVEKALLETNRLLDAILNSTHMLVACLDRDFNFVLVNRAYAEADQRQPEFFRGKNHFDLYPNEENRAIFRRVVETGEPFFCHAKPFVYPANPERGLTYWDWGLAAIKDDGGQVSRLVLTLTDVTERGRAEEELKRLNETLEERVVERTALAEQRAGQLRLLAAELTQAEQRERHRLARILHDHLQQLLVAARMNVGLVQRRESDDNLRPKIAQIDDLLNQAITESRSLTVELSPPVLYDGGLAAALNWLARRTEEQHPLSVEVEADRAAEPADVPTRVFLFQAARELLFNVVKHAEASVVHVRMSTVGRDLIRLEVHDNGIGCDVAMMDPEGRPGGGFGLFSIHQRLKVLDGHLEVQASPGEGTSVVIVAPSGQAAAAPGRATKPLEPAARPAPAQRAARQGKLRILLVDDHAILRQGLAGLLRENAEFDVVGEAADGQQAIDMTLRLRPDVVLMDITMPGMSGIEATRRITDAMPQTRVIGLSMHEKEDMGAAMCRAGAVAYLQKDAAAEVLIDAILAQKPV